MKDNFYILLKLDPKITDEKSINEAILKKQQEWATQRNHPTKGVLAKQYSALLPDIRILMSDSILRANEAKEAVKILINEEKERNKELVLKGSILVNNGEIKKQDLEKLLKKEQFKSFNETEALKILGARIKRKAKSTYVDDGVKPIDSSTLKSIKENLNILNKGNLFDFLGLQQSSSCSTIIVRANEIRNINNRQTNKTAEVTATNTLVSMCSLHLKDDTSKNSYIKSLELESFSKIYELIDIAAGDKVVDKDEFEKIMIECARSGIKTDKAEYYIQKYCEKKKYTLLISENAQYKKLIQCNICGYLNNPKASNCSNCSFPLKVNCPKCNNQAEAGSNACSKCGFNIGDMPNAIPLIRDAKIQFANGNNKFAKQMISEAEIYWPGNIDIKPIKESIDKRKKLIDNLVFEIESLVLEKRFNQVETKLLQLLKEDKTNPAISLHKAKTSNRIRQATEFCRKARSEIIGEKKLDYFLSALEECSDFPDALIGSASIPVPSPSGLAIRKTKKSVSLKWNPLKSRKAIRYRVIRKVNSKPINITDGKSITELTSTTFNDIEIESGISYFYAVYAVRGNAFSDTAETIGPIIITSDIVSLSIVSDSNTLNLLWKTPANVYRIDIFKKENSKPIKYGDGSRLSTFNKGNFTDTKVRNEKQYGYRVFCIYEDCNGKEHISDGASIIATPSSPPIPIKDISYKLNKHVINVKWSASNKGDVQILRTTNKINIPEGTSISINQISDYGSVLTNNSKTTAIFNKDFQGIIYLTPLVVYNDSAIVGNDVCITSIEDVRHTKGLLSAGKIYLEWTWPIGCKRVKILYSHDNYPKNNTSVNKHTAYLTKDEYDQKLAFEIKQPVSKDYYFSIYACSNNNGKEILSTGINELVVNSEQIKIMYKIVVKKLFSKRAYLEIWSDKNFKLPDFKLIVKHAGLPLNITDGTCLMKIPCNQLNKILRVDISKSTLGKNKFVRLFLVDSTLNKRYKLIMPSKDNLELK